MNGEACKKRRKWRSRVSMVEPSEIKALSKGEMGGKGPKDWGGPRNGTERDGARANAILLLNHLLLAQKKGVGNMAARTG